MSTSHISRSGHIQEIGSYLLPQTKSDNYDCDLRLNLERSKHFPSAPQTYSTFLAQKEEERHYDGTQVLGDCELPTQHYGSWRKFKQGKRHITPVVDSHLNLELGSRFIGEIFHKKFVTKDTISITGLHLKDGNGEMGETLPQYSSA